MANSQKSKAYQLPIDARIVIGSTLNEDTDRQFNTEAEASGLIEKDGSKRWITAQVLLPWFTTAEMDAGIPGLASGLERLAKEYASLRIDGKDSGEYTIETPESEEPNAPKVVRSYPVAYVPANLAEDVFLAIDKGITLTVQGKLNQALQKKYLVDSNGSRKPKRKSNRVI